MNKNITKAFALIMLSLIAGFFVSCKDKKTLDEAGDDIYITLSPSSGLVLQYEGDTVEMKCVVKNFSGDVIPTEVKWSTNKPELATFKKGTNKLYAVASPKENADIQVRATLPNGRYAVTKATVTRWNVKELELLKAPSSSDIDKGELITKLAYLGKDVYLNLDESLLFWVRVNPTQVADQAKLSFDGVDDKLFTVEELVLDPKNAEDAKKIAVTPEGIKWCKLQLKPSALFTKKKLTVKLTEGKTTVKTRFNLSAGTRLSELYFGRDLADGIITFENKELGFNEDVDIDVYASLEFYSGDGGPCTPEMTEQLIKGMKWEIKNEQGGSCVIAEVKLKEYEEYGAHHFVVRVHSGGLEGSSTLIASYQGQKIECAIDVKKK